MATSSVRSAPSLYLTAVLAERGALPVEEGLPLLRQLLAQVRALHAAGRTHRAIGPQTVRLDPAGCATLTDPVPVQELGGADADPESCPPELHGAAAVRLPEEIEAARQVLSEAGVELDPRRIDVYQLGALLCRLLTGQPVSAYLRSPKTLALVPAALQPVVKRALGYSAARAPRRLRRLRRRPGGPRRRRTNPDAGPLRPRQRADAVAGHDPRGRRKRTVHVLRPGRQGRRLQGRAAVRAAGTLPYPPAHRPRRHGRRLPRLRGGARSARWPSRCCRPN